MSELAINGNNSPNPDTATLTRVEEHDSYTLDSGDENVQSTDATILAINGDSNGYNEGPPLKRRKVVEESSHKSSPRAPSPPWKKITADGPTTFVDNGRRRSGRTNVVPLEQQTHLGKRQTRATYDRMLEKKGHPSYKSGVKQKAKAPVVQNSIPTDNVMRRGPGRPPKVKVEEMDNAVAPATILIPSRRKGTRNVHRLPPVLRGHGRSNVSSLDEDRVAHKPRSPSPPLTLQKVKFRVALPKPFVSTPQNAPPPKKYLDFRDFFENDPLEPCAGQDLLPWDQIQKEAQARQRLQDAHWSGQLAGDSKSNAILEKQFEPRKQYAHHDHLLVHVHHFRNLLRQERKDHKRKAEQIAHEAKKYLEEKQKRGRVKTADEVAQEHMERMRLQYRFVIKDIDRLWLAVQLEVNAVRQRQFEEEQQAKLKSHLNRVLERTDEMLTRREDSLMTSDVESGTDPPTDDEDQESDSEVMSTSSSGSGSASERDDPDETLTAEQLRIKYEKLSEVDLQVDEDEDDLATHAAAPRSSSEESDPDIEMDSEFDSLESDEDGDDEVDEDDDQNADQPALLSLLFSKKEVAAMAEEDMQNNTADTAETLGDEAESNLIDPIEADSEADGMDTTSAFNINGHSQRGSPPPEHPTGTWSETTTRLPDLLNLNNPDGEETDPKSQNVQEPTSTDIPIHVVERDERMSQDASSEASPDTSGTKISEPDSVSSIEAQSEVARSDRCRDEKTNVKTPVPSLLRGTLREYQHEGLDWLANLYANGRSGILADEMGLGKTIQSIALLGHLATEYEVWGPHLIVVPTSVMLNWEMEFKKFLPGFKILTYYGNLEERKQKRRGWMADDSFNVCITSYQLVLQDANSFKRRRWHYMILDEAHNIKNFRSERWQTMMTFNTRARLLLTGTPLQNNLTELWSLLFFLHYGQEGQDEDEAFAGLKEWSEWFKRPVESILEHGRQVLDQEDKDQVSKLHKVIRPFLLRRLKADVEKQMPAKYEHVELCRLSKRQRQLYDGFMSRAQTKETLASGNYLSIINALMQLRKVCNHPDLFETRPINTSFSMPKSVVAQFEIKDLLLQRKLFGESPLNNVDLDFLQLVPISNERISMIENLETVRRHAYHPFKALRDSQWSRINRHLIPKGQQRTDILTTLENVGRKARLQDIDRTMYYEAYRHHQRPIYGRGLLEKLNFQTTYAQLSHCSSQEARTKIWDLGSPLTSFEFVQSVDVRSERLAPIIEQYACVTPAVMATDLCSTYVTELGATKIRNEIASYNDPFHQARMKLSIAFPDKRLLQYDCGKLQRLDKLLRRLQTGGHRALIFTQMTKVLDILEQFLNIHGHKYLRLDGATKIEQRQILTDRFNSDQRILCFILSSRSGGLGINLTGADTVIFYDLDWNPAMDRQCTDRAHRIGQTRDVHIYRFVSDHTIESNILRKANQKQLLDDVVIQEGDFTTDYLNKVTYQDMLDDPTNDADDVAGAAMDRVLGNDKTAVAAFEQAEDQEDVSAAKVAAKEVQHADDGDFEDKTAATPLTGESGTPGPYGATNAAIADADESGIHHIDDYLLKLQTFLLKDIPLAPPKDKAKRSRKRVDEHRKRRPR